VSSHEDSQKEVLDILKDILNGADKGPPPKKASFASKMLKRTI